MMKTALFVLLLLTFALGAEEAERDSLDLGKIVIEGEVKLERDSLSTIPEMQQYNRLSDLERFDYEPRFQPFYQEPRQGMEKKYKLLISLLGGQPILYNARARYYDHKLDIFNIAAGYYKENIKIESINKIIYNISWLPSFKFGSIGMSYKKYEFNNTYINLNQQNVDYVLFSYDHFIQGLTTDQSELSLKIGYVLFKQYINNIIYWPEDELPEEQEDYDLEFGFGTKLRKTNLNFNLYYFKENIAGDFQVNWEKVMIFNKLGLWLGAWENRLMAAPDFTVNLLLVKNLFFRFQNTPGLDYASRYNDMTENPYVSLKSDKKPEFKPLDLTVALDLHTDLGLSLYYNINGTLDRNTYDAHPGSLYTYDSIDLITRKTGVSLDLAFWKLKINNRFHYYQYSVVDLESGKLNEIASDVPYEPGMEDILSITVGDSRWQAGADLIYLLDRKDDSNNELEDVIRIDLSAHYFVLPNIKFKAGFNNLLDRTDPVYPGIAVSEIRYLFGFDLFF